MNSWACADKQKMCTLNAQQLRCTQSHTLRNLNRGMAAIQPQQVEKIRSMSLELCYCLFNAFFMTDILSEASENVFLEV